MSSNEDRQKFLDELAELEEKAGGVLAVPPEFLKKMKDKKKDKKPEGRTDA